MEPQSWEAVLEKVERDLAEDITPPALRDPMLELALIIAQQLRELLQGARPLFDHPLIRRR